MELVKMTEMKVLDGYKLQVQLSDGRSGVFDMTPYLKGSVFVLMKDLNYFAKAKLIHEGRGVEWPNGEDLCIDLIEEDLK